MSALPQPLTDAGTDGLLPDEQKFWDAAFLRLLPTAMTVQGWSVGEKPISSGSQRTNLAAVWADYAVKERRNRETNGLT